MQFARALFGGDPKRTRFAVLALAATAAVLVVAELVLPPLVATYKVSLDVQEASCIPWMAFLVKKGDVANLRRGELVQFTAPEDIGRKKGGKQFIKFVAGMPGDRLEVKNDTVYVNGQYWGGVWGLAELVKPERYFDRNVVVPPGKVLMLSVARKSFDGRYWGFVDQERLVGRATPLF